jgi:hypothetical protein
MAPTEAPKWPDALKTVLDRIQVALDDARTMLEAEAVGDDDDHDE